jgi:hypothetical protein
MGQEEKSEIDEVRAEVDALSADAEGGFDDEGGIGGEETAIDEAMKYAVVSRLVATEGKKVRWMYREEPTEPADTGWRFFSGDEADDFADDQENFEFHPLDTVTELDPSIAPHLERTAPVAFERETADGPFTEVADFAPPGTEEPESE